MELAIDSHLLFSMFFTLYLFGHLTCHHPEGVERFTYIIHMDKSCMPKAFSSHHDWYTSTVHSLTLVDSQISNGSGSTLIYSYDNVMHGFSALLSLDEVENLKKSYGFVSAYIGKEIKSRTTHTPKFLSLSPSTGIWPASNYGKDVIIGVIDSGVWPESPSFKDDGMKVIPKKWKGICEEGMDFNASSCNSKLIGARYFNKGLRASNPDVNLSMNSPRDDNGHGTLCASIAAGNFVDDVSFFGYAPGTASGTAPSARLAVYKAFWNGQAQSSDILAAIDQAVADGVDVISLSQGLDEDLPFYENVFAISCFGAMENGIFISHAGGNTGYDLGSLYDSMPWTMTVAAGSVDRWFSGTLTLGNGLSITGWSTFPASALVDNLPLVYDKRLSLCNSIEQLAQAPHGIIICERTGYLISQMLCISDSPNVAAAIYISDNQPLEPYFPWPGVVLNSKDWSIVVNYAKTNGSSASMKFKETILGVKPAPLVAKYSSRGPSRTYNGILKPDILAPGSLVLGAWMPNKYLASIGTAIKLTSDYAMFSGTSLSCPHIAGVAALLKAAHPSWSPAMIRSAMMTTANPLDNTGNVILDPGRNWKFSSPLDIGSGHVDPNRALDPGLVYNTTPQDYVNVLCYMNYTDKQLLTLTRSRSYNCSNPSSDLNYPSFIALYSNTSSKHLVKSFSRTLINVGQGYVTYHAEVLEPIGSKVTVSPKILVFNGTYDEKSFTMTLEYDSYEDKTVTHGSIVWVEDNGKHRVRSPIVVSPEVKI